MRVTFSPKKFLTVQQCSVLSPVEIDEYISVSKTCRLLIVSYVKNGQVLAQNLIDISFCTYVSFL